MSWLQNANTNGRMAWFDANTRADNLVFAGFDNWRLPTSLQPDPSCSIQGSFDSLGWNCTGSEMGHLYYTEQGNTAFSVIVNVGDFTNLPQNHYWSGTDYSADTYRVWDFYFLGFFGGHQNVDFKDSFNYAMAIRPGDVSTSVPEPATLLLLGSGLAGIVV